MIKKSQFIDEIVDCMFAQKSFFRTLSELQELIDEVYLDYVYSVSPMSAIYIDPKIIDASRGITYERAKLSLFEKVKIFLGFMDEPEKIKFQSKSLLSLIPRTLPPKFKYRIGDIT